MANTLIDLNNNKLIFDNKEIIYTNDNENELWFKAVDVAKILGYVNPSKSIRNHVDSDYKKSYNDIYISSGSKMDPPLSNNEKITTYINESGLYELIMNSKLEIAKNFKKWIFNDVLPQIRKTGSYSIQSDKKLLESNYWVDNSIVEYDDKNVIYVGYIGIHNNEQLFKFGISEQIYTREFEQHRKNFEIFKMVHIEICDNKRVVEATFKKMLSALSLLRKQIFNSKNQTELFTITPQFDLDKIIKLLKDCIEQNPLPIVKNLKIELNSVKLKLMEMTDENKELKNKIKELEDIRKNQTEQLNNHISLLVQKELQNNNKDQNEIIEKNEIIEENKNEEKEIVEEIINIKNIQEFFDIYTEFGEDTSSNDKFRISFEDLYKFYCEKCLDPIDYLQFNKYIRVTFELKEAVCNWFLKSYNTWMGIKIKAQYKHETKLDIYLRNFIQNNCKTGEGNFIDTKLFNESFKEYCEEKEPDEKAVKYLGITPTYIKRKLIEFGYGYKEWIIEGKKHGYTGLTFNNLLTIKESIQEYINDCCELSYGYRVKTTILWETYQKYIKDKNIYIKIVRKQFYDCLMNDFKLTKKYVSKYDKGFIGIKLKL